MNHSRRTHIFCTSVAALLLSACSKHPPTDPATAPTPVAARSVPAPIAAPVIAAPPAPGQGAVPVGAPATSAATLPAVPISAAPAAATAPFALDKLALGDAVNASHQIVQPAASFASTDKVLYASVATTGNSSGVTLNAKWRYLEGQGQLVSSVSQSIATDGPAVTTFKVQNPDLWPEGKYKVEISIDGKAVASQDFVIGKG